MRVTRMRDTSHAPKKSRGALDERVPADANYVDWTHYAKLNSLQFEVATTLSETRVWDDT